MINTLDPTYYGITFYGNPVSPKCPCVGLPGYINNLSKTYNKEVKTIEKKIIIVDSLSDNQPKKITTTYSPIDYPIIDLTELQNIYNKIVDAYNTSSEIISSSLNAINNTNIIVDKFSYLSLENPIVPPIDEILRLIDIIKTQTELMIKYIFEFNDIIKQLDFDTMEKINREIYNKLQVGGGEVKIYHNKVLEIKQRLEMLMGYFGQYPIDNNSHNDSLDKLKTKIELPEKGKILKYFTENISETGIQPKLIDFAAEHIDTFSTQNPLSLETSGDKPISLNMIDDKLIEYNNMINVLKEKINNITARNMNLDVIITLNDITYNASDFEFIANDKSLETSMQMKENADYVQLNTKKLLLLQNIKDMLSNKNENSAIYNKIKEAYISLRKIMPNLTETIPFGDIITGTFEEKVNGAIFNTPYIQNIKKIQTDVQKEFERTSKLKNWQNQYLYPIYSKTYELIAKNLKLNDSITKMNEIIIAINSIPKKSDVPDIVMTEKWKNEISIISKNCEAQLTLIQLVNLVLQILGEFKKSTIYSNISELYNTYKDQFVTTDIQKECNDKILFITEAIDKINRQTPSLEEKNKELVIDTEYFATIFNHLKGYMIIANKQISETIIQINNIKEHYPYFILNNLKDLNVTLNVNPLWYKARGGGGNSTEVTNDIKKNIDDTNNNYKIIYQKLETMAKTLDELKYLYNTYMKINAEMLEKNLYVAYHILYLLTVIKEISDKKFNMNKFYSYKFIATARENIQKIVLPYLTGTINRMKLFGKQLEIFFTDKEKIIVLSYNKKSFIDLITFIHLSSLVTN